MVLSIYHLNSKGIFHRDLKPANFLIHEEEDKIYLHVSDFRIAKNEAEQNKFNKL